jgi:tetratricopeptide (TPR) repeat protein
VNIDSVNHYISLQSKYDQQKEKRIEEIKKIIALNTNDSNELYSMYCDLYEEYRSYIYDSAHVYVKKLIDISNESGNSEKIISSKIKLGFCYLSSGLFKEAFDILSSLNIDNCDRDTKIEYYLCKSRLYYDLADYDNMPELSQQYKKIGNCIIDSALQLLPPNTYRYWMTLGLKKMKSDDYEGAIEGFLKMIDCKGYSKHDLAISTSSIAYVLSLQGKKNEAKEYLMRAAIADVESSTKETVALRNLAQLLYEDGDVTTAVNYIRQALNDATFYNARHRQLEIGSILPIIEGERINIIEKQRDRVIMFIIFISVLLILLVVALVIIWKSLKRLDAAKLKIQSANEKLMEANRIKSEYIGYFFNQNAEYIEKLGSFQRWVNKKVITKQYEDLKNFPKQINLEKEREALFERFDKIFLNLFPNFVEEFNKLLKPEEQIHLQKGELLNPEMRIYALIRLGIDDNEKIAHFLDYSVNTIYAYKTKVKNKTLYSSKEFKQKVLEIKSY